MTDGSSPPNRDSVGEQALEYWANVYYRLRAATGWAYYPALSVVDEPTVRRLLTEACKA